jgi:hypothetical protein
MTPWWAWLLVSLEAVGFVFCLDFLLREFWGIRPLLTFKHHAFNRSWVKTSAVIGFCIAFSLIWWYTAISATLNKHWWPRFLRGAPPEIVEEEIEETGEGWNPQSVTFPDTAQGFADQAIHRASMYDPYPDEGVW